MPTDFRTKTITLVKGWYWYLEINIEAILFNLERWWWSIIRHTNTLVNCWQISSEWCEILDSLHHQIELKLHQKSLGQAVRKWLMISLPYGHESPMVRSVTSSEHRNFYCQDTFMHIIRKYMLRENQWDLPGITKIHVALMYNIHMLLQKIIQIRLKFKRFGIH